MGSNDFVNVYADYFIAKLHVYGVKVASEVNEYLSSIGARPVSGVVLWPRCSSEEDSNITGSYDLASGVIRLYYCPSRGFDLTTLGHEIVHHLQATGHPSVQVKGRRLMEAEVILFKYHDRPHEKEAYDLQEKVARELATKRPGIRRLLEEAASIARLAYSIAYGRFKLKARCPGLAIGPLAATVMEHLLGQPSEPAMLRLAPHPTRDDRVVVEVALNPKLISSLSAGQNVRVSLTLEVEPAFRRFLEHVKEIRVEGGALEGRVERPPSAWVQPGLLAVTLEVEAGLARALFGGSPLGPGAAREPVKLDRVHIVDGVTSLLLLLGEYLNLDLQSGCNRLYLSAFNALKEVRDILSEWLSGADDFVQVKLDCEGEAGLGNYSFRITGSSLRFDKHTLGALLGLVNGMLKFLEKYRNNPRRLCTSVSDIVSAVAQDPGQADDEDDIISV